MAASSTGVPSLVTVRVGGIERDRADRDGASAGGSLTAPEDRTDACHELSCAERLDHIVVSTELQSHDPIDLLATGGEHDDGHVGSLSDLAAEVPAVPVREHHVEQDDVRSVPLEGVSGVGKALRELGLETLPDEVPCQRLGDRRLVLDDEHASLHRTDGSAVTSSTLSFL